MTFRMTQLSLVISGLFLASGAFAQSTSSDLGTSTVQGSTGGTDTGLIQAEDTPKARSSVNKAYIEKQGPANPYQLINLLPGVNANSQDATGLFGGSIRIRGFNSDQLGFTIDGAPVNDSGSFSVFPQEYTDTENLCDIFVTQGSTDNEAPHVGATGGNIGIVPCLPEDKMGTRVALSAGQLSYYKAFIRYNSGKFLNDLAKFYLSASQAHADKFKGQGAADRDHVDFKGVLQVAPGSTITAGLLYNRAINANLRTLTYPQIAQFGSNFDNGTIAPVHQPAVNGTAQNDTTYAPNANIFTGQGNSFTNFSLNPFKNYLATVQGRFQLAPKLRLDIDPYFWYGYGTGGNELTSLAESSGTNRIGGGIRDLNGDGDTRDTVGVYRGSLTETFRPGVTTKLNWQLDNVNNIVAGVWYERARHHQTQPAVPISNNGTAADLWLDSNNILHQDGTPYEGRNTLTISEAHSVFAQDNLSLMGDKLNVQLAVKNVSIKRNFANYASDGAGAGADYTVNKTYTDTLPSLGIKYALTDVSSVFFNVAKNSKAPGNFTYFGLLQGGTIVNGRLTGYTQLEPPVKEETSNNIDLGYRYQTDLWTFSGSLYYVDYKNRIAQSFDPNTALSTATNVGDSTTRGFELESGYKINNNFSAYGSLSYTKSQIKKDLRLTAVSYLNTAGKEFPDTPNWLAGVGVQYTSGPIFGSLEAKYTGKRYSTLVNDESAANYTLVNLTAGYKLPSTTFFKNPQVRLNIANLFDKDYLLLNAGSGSSFTNSVNPATGAGASFYIGAPRFTSVTLQSDF